MTQNDPNKIENSDGYLKSERLSAKRRGWFWLLLLIILLAILFGWRNYKDNTTSVNPINNQHSGELQLDNSNSTKESDSEATKNDRSAADSDSSATSRPAPDSAQSSLSDKSASTESSSSTDATSTDPHSSTDDGSAQYGSSSDANDDSNSTPVVSPNQDQSASAKNPEAAPTVISSESLAALAKLNTYFKNDSSKDSEWIDLDDVSFAVGSADPEFNTEKFKRVAELLASHRDNHFLIHGFTDSTGPADLNKNLSTERANKISHFLIENGVNSEQIEIEGQGAKAAVADNNTQDGRDKNRRVAIKVLAAK